MSTATLEDYDLDLDEVVDGDSSAPSELADEEVLSEEAKDFVHKLTERILLFMDALVGHALYPYQRRLAYRIVQSVILNDGAEITALMARQSGKTETVADVLATLMILLPRLAKRYPTWLEQFKNGLMVGCFAPVEDQAQTLFARIVQRLTSAQAVEIMAEPDINDEAVGGGKLMTLKNSGSFVRLQTAHERANIESKTYHIIVIDEAQSADERVVRKSIHPMGASTNATIIKTGTPTYTKGDFYKAIQHNKRLAVARGGVQNHFEANWREVIKYNPRYKKYIRKEMSRIGEESDEFQLSYNLKWLLERGMFTTTDVMDALGDRGMEIVKAWKRSPLVAGLDVARKQDSTVCTVLWVDWNNPDEFGYFDHRVLNWLEIHGDQWEEQYAQVVDFLSNYDIAQIGVDGQGMGDLYADRMSRLLPNVDVQALPSHAQEQSKRWKHLTELMSRRLISWPAHPYTRRLRTYKRFYQQMTDAERIYKGGNMLVAAPNENDAHDDYPDSLALATWLTRELTMPTIEVSNNTFYARSR